MLMKQLIVMTACSSSVSMRLLDGSISLVISFLVRVNLVISWKNFKFVSPSRSQNTLLFCFHNLSFVLLNLSHFASSIDPEPSDNFVDTRVLSIT